MITEKDSKLPPKELNEWDLLTEIKDVSEIKSFDFKSSSIPTLKSGLSPNNCYAVIISGGFDMANNWQRYWNDCSAIYSTLVDVYNYEDDHIYTIMSDGTDTANDRRVSGGYDSSPLDLDGDGDNDIQFSATRANITSVFNTLSELLDSDDYLFIFVTDHGDQESGQDALIYLWGETIRDDQFATEVDKVNAGEISIVMEQCYSGGFVDDLSGLNRVIATACDFDETSCGMGYYTYDEFVFDWIAAVAGEDPNGNSVDADVNNDGFVCMQEAFGYAKNNNACSETPQYSSIPINLGDNLSLFGKIPSILGSSSLCYSNSSYSINNLPSGATVIWSTSNDISRVSPQGSNPCVFKGVSGVLAFNSNISAVISYNGNSFTIEKEIQVGTKTPSFHVLDATNHQVMSAGYVGSSYYLNAFGNNLSNNSSDYRWEIIFPADPINGRIITILGKDFTPTHSGYYVIKLQYNGECGWSNTATKRFAITDQSYFRLYPNPSSNNIVTIEQTDNSNASLNSLANIELTLYDNMMNLRLKKKVEGKVYRLNTASLKKGVYYVHIKMNNANEVHKLIIK
ncbi:MULTISPECIES: T9SS type A sorting domain-containing protein [unclassified Carboxylicivirga]|uniref:T9SS type A sorting domain-containing protein n=1 Tax=Carboxylicivirga TaxID=1628153 RepID=UPI003D3536A9